MNAVMVYANGRIERVAVANDWHAMSILIGGYLEVVRRCNLGLLGEGIVMVVDEDGLMKRREVNPLGSALYGGDIVGDVLIIGEGMTAEGADFVTLADPVGVEQTLRLLQLELP